MVMVSFCHYVKKVKLRTLACKHSQESLHFIFSEIAAVFLFSEFILFGFPRSNVILIIMVLCLISSLNDVVKFSWGLISIIDYSLPKEVGIFNENSMLT